MLLAMTEESGGILWCWWDYGDSVGVRQYLRRRIASGTD